MMELVNLTPHPMHIYGLDTPDRIEPGSVEPIRVIEPSAEHEPARLGSDVLWSETPYHGLGVPVNLVQFGGRAIKLPPQLDRRRYLVSLAVGLAAIDRQDLLVPGDYVRDLDGHVIGCRQLARPAHYSVQKESR